MSQYFLDAYQIRIGIEQLRYRGMPKPVTGNVDTAFSGIQFYPFFMARTEIGLSFQRPLVRVTGLDLVAIGGETRISEPVRGDFYRLLGYLSLEQVKRILAR